MEIEDGTVLQTLCALKVDIEHSESTFELHPLSRSFVTYSSNKPFARVIAFGKAFDAHNVVRTKSQVQIWTTVRSH